MNADAMIRQLGMPFVVLIQVISFFVVLSPILVIARWGWNSDTQRAVAWLREWQDAYSVEIIDYQEFYPTVHAWLNFYRRSFKVIVKDRVGTKRIALVVCEISPIEDAVKSVETDWSFFSSDTDFS